MAIKSRKKVVIGAGLLFAASFVGYAAWSSTEKVPVQATNFSPSFATPVGVTLQPLGKAQGYSLDKESAAYLSRDEIVFATPAGMTLYTYADDPSSCVEDCSKQFSALIAPAGAVPFGDWSLANQGDGAKQWAYRGKPLYSYVLDVDPGSVAGNSPALTGSPRMDGAGKPIGGGIRGNYSEEKPEPKVLPEKWEPVHFLPLSSFQSPPGISVREVPDAAGLALVDTQNHTLYVYEGATDDCGNKCGGDWKPYKAPLIVQPFGDFGVVDRKDGIRQWTYKGKGLYTFGGDLAPNFANGAFQDDWGVALVYRFYMPPGVTLERASGQGVVLAANNGKTLYRRDGHIYQSGGGHNLRRGRPARPAVGRELGPDPHCADEKCHEMWSPLIAPDNAQAHGFWTVDVREDGQKQWAYQGYAMWFFAGDKKPGDINGDDTYDYKLSHDPETKVEVGTPMDGAAALYWSIAVP